MFPSTDLQRQSIDADVVHARGRWFVGGCPGIVGTGGYFYCKEKSSPFSLKLRRSVVDGSPTYVSVEKILFPHHYHEAKDKTRKKNREYVAECVRAAESGTGECETMKDNCPCGTRGLLKSAER